MNRHSTKISHLNKLQPHSGKHLSRKFQYIIKDNKEPLSLVRRELVSSGVFNVLPKKDIAVLSGQQSIRKTHVFPQVGENPKLLKLNSALSGGSNYPILTAALGIGAGMVSFGSGLVFSATTTAVSLSHRDQRVLARPGDEIWNIEEIGKIQDGGSIKAVYVSSFFIVDPFRKQAHGKGWLIHEERLDLDID